MLVLRNADGERARTKTYPCNSCGGRCANCNVKLTLINHNNVYCHFVGLASYLRQLSSFAAYSACVITLQTAVDKGHVASTQLSVALKQLARTCRRAVRLATI